MDIVVSNTENVPGRTITRFFGVVSGSTVRTKHIGRDLAAGFKNIFGGELKGYTELLRESRDDALERMLEEADLEMTAWRPAGGPFEAIAYCWVQALQYLPEAERTARRQWFFEEHFPELMALDRRCRDNLERRHTSFPVAFSIDFRRP